MNIPARKFIFSTSRLIFKRFTQQDCEGFYCLNNDPEVIKYTGDRPFKNRAETSLFIKNYNHYDLYGYGRWSVYLKDTFQYIGFCGLKFSEEKKEIDIGFRFLKTHWNKGYATEAAKGCIVYANSIGITSLVARVHQKNEASIKVIEKLKMEYTHDFIENDAIWKKYHLHLSS